MSVSPSSRRVPRDEPRSATGERRGLDFPVPQWLRGLCMGDNSGRQTAPEVGLWKDTPGCPFYAVYVLILVMGLRKGEVIGLPWSAVNLDQAELDIGWQLQRVGG
jgi:hypothetical protein